MTAQTDSNVPQIRFKGFEGEWEEKTFDQNILSIQTGTNLLGSITGKGTPLLKMGNIQRGSFSFERLECLDGDAKVEAENIAHFGDFLFNTRNTLDLVGKGATWMGESGKFAFNSNLARFKFQGINTIFFNYLYNTSSLVVQVKARAMGTTSVAAIYPKNLNSLEYSLPAPAEQTQIGEYFRELDRLIGLHQRKHDKLVTLKKAMLQKMLPQPGAPTPEIRFKGFSGDWVEKKLHSLADRYDNLRIPVSASNRIPGNTPYYGANGVQGYVHGYTHDGEFILVAEDGANDLKNYPVQYVIGKIWVNNHAHVLQGKVGLAETRFLKYAFAQINVDAFLVGGGRSKLNAETMMQLELCSPVDIEEQQKIGTYFRTLDELISKHGIQLQKLQQIKSACLEKMFV